MAVKISIVLDSLTYPHNVGSILRIADAVQAEKVWLCGTTPSPVSPSGEWAEDVIKMAVGTEAFVPWEKGKPTIGVLQKLKSDGYVIVALHQSPESIDYRSANIPDDASIAMVVGNEMEGISKDALNLTDMKIEMPVLGVKDSLNPAIACAVAAYSLVFGGNKK